MFHEIGHFVQKLLRRTIRTHYDTLIEYAIIYGTVHHSPIPFSFSVREIFKNTVVVFNLTYFLAECFLRLLSRIYRSIG